MARRTGKPSYLLAPAGRPRRPGVRIMAGIAVAALVAGLVGALIGLAVGRPSETEASINELRVAEAERDARQIVELTALARRTGEQLSPIVVALTGSGKAGRAPDAAQVRQWQQTMRELTEGFADPPSGATATNVARGGLRSAVEQAAVAVDLAALAATGPDAADREQLALAARQADLAVATWSVAATQLDQINIDAGHGHQHVHLDGGEEHGAMTPDGAAEGSGG